MVYKNERGKPYPDQPQPPPLYLAGETGRRVIEPPWWVQDIRRHAGQARNSASRSYWLVSNTGAYQLPDAWNRLHLKSIKNVKLPSLPPPPPLLSFVPLTGGIQGVCLPLGAPHKEKGACGCRQLLPLRVILIEFFFRKIQTLDDWKCLPQYAGVLSCNWKIYSVRKNRKQR